MPRGVPKNGVRRSAYSGPLAAAGSSVAAGPVYGQARDESPAEEEAVAPESAPEQQLIEDEETPVASEPEPVSEPSPEQLEIKRLRDQLARERGKKDVEPEVDEVASPGDDGNILIHFLEDGLSALGRVWFRGQELEFEVAGQAYRDTFDRFGRSWLELRNDEFAQVERWGKVMFRTGPWPGKAYRDGKFETLRGEREGSFVAPPSEAELAAAEKAEAKRRRSAPRLPAAV